MGMGLANAYGAAGAADALQQILADRIAAEKVAYDRQRQAAQDDRLVRLDAEAAEERASNRQRLRAQDERQARLEAAAAEDKAGKQAIEMATLFPGQVVSGETVRRAPKYLQELIAKPKAEQLEGRSIGGFSNMAGAAPAGEIATEEHAAVGPDSFELQLPVSERMRLAGERQAAMEAKADKDRELAQARLTEQRRHDEQIEALRAASAGKGSGRLVKRTYEDPDTGEVMEEYVTPDEARAMGPTKKPKTQKPVTGAERQTLAYYNRAQEANDILTSSPSGPSGLKQASLEDRIARQGTGGQYQLEYAPNIFQSKDQQAYRQLQRTFTEARLRKESGAAIPDAEYAADAQTYFAIPGDTPQQIAQKRQMRQKVLEGMKFSAGRAYDEFYGESGAPTAGAEFDFDPKTGSLVPRKQ